MLTETGSNTAVSSPICLSNTWRVARVTEEMDVCMHVCTHPLHGMLHILLGEAAFSV